MTSFCKTDVDEINEFIKGSDIICSYNAAFDEGVLRNNFNTMNYPATQPIDFNMKIHCLLEDAQRLHKAGLIKSDNTTLDAVYKALTGKRRQPYTRDSFKVYTKGKRGIL